MPSSHLILCCPLLFLPSIFSSIRVFSYESALRIRWPKYWSFSFNISPSNEYSGLISFRMDWLDLLAVQGTLKSLLQHHSSKASILQCSTFFIVQLSHPYMTIGKTIALTRQTFVGKVMSLVFNMLSSLVITFLPRSKHLLIPWHSIAILTVLVPGRSSWERHLWSLNRIGSLVSWGWEISSEAISQKGPSLWNSEWHWFAQWLLFFTFCAEARDISLLWITLLKVAFFELTFNSSMSRFPTIKTRIGEFRKS